MAYISTDKVAYIREKLKMTFPEIKFSVRQSNHTSLVVTIKQSPYDFLKRNTDDQRMRNLSDDQFNRLKQNYSINHYHLGNYNHQDILKKIVDICNEGNHDNSNVMADYFDVGWYLSLTAGSYDKPYKITK